MKRIVKTLTNRKGGWSVIEYLRRYWKWALLPIYAYFALYAWGSTFALILSDDMTLFLSILEKAFYVIIIAGLIGVFIFINHQS